MTDAEVHTAVIKWIRARTGLAVGRVIKGDQSGDRVQLPYIMARFTGTAAVRTHPQEIEWADQGEAGVLAAPVIETEWRFSVHAFGGGGSDLLRSLRSAASLAQANEPLMPGLVIHEMSQIRFVPELINEVWESRAQVDLFIRGLTKDGHLVDTIEQFTVEVTSDRT